jgi:histidine kinase
MQPLNAARMFVDAARGRLTAAAGQEVVNGIDSALAAEDEILSTLLDISRLESGTLEVHERKFPLGALLETLGREFGVIARARGIELRVVHCGVTVHSDEALLRRILQNYLSNAMRYGRGGRILMGCRRAAGVLRIEVWDRGPGIAPEHHRRIFHEFQRLDTGQPSEGGAGLGLAIVERIATRLGHRIGLRSWVGRGSVFFVEVPRVEAAVPARQAPALSPPSPSGNAAGAARDLQSALAGRRVFSVEDDPRVRQSVHTLLSGWGCEVMLASSAQEALRLAAQGGAIPDLLLLDYRLPDGKGPELVPELFRQWGSEVPVLVMSAEPDAAVRENVQASGWSFLAKPVSPSKLRAALTHLLMRRAAPV